MSKIKLNKDIHHVGLALDGRAGYNNQAPFHPHLRYPECRCDETSESGGADAFALVREALFQLGLDRARYGTPDWNPLGEIISPGDSVALKPNWVLDTHPRGLDIFSVITHPSLIRAALDYTLLALDGEGEVTVCDAPQADCNFERVFEISQLSALKSHYEEHAGTYGGIIPKFIDLRKIAYLVDDDGYLKDNSRITLAGDPNGYFKVNLGSESLLYHLENLENLYGADYDRNFTSEHHSGERQEYLVSGTILKADVVISLPKMKSHKKTGVTLNLKNLVGINGDKNYLAHFRVGASDAGGDEYPARMDGKQKLILKSQRALIDKLLVKPNKFSVGLFNLISAGYRLLRRASKMDLTPAIRLGDWSGNDTAWRMVIDLNRILFLADEKGVMRETPQRGYFSIVDGIIAGEGDGPLDPDPRTAGIVLAGHSPIPVDLAAMTLMGFDYRKLRLYDYIVGDKQRVVEAPYAVNDPGRIRVSYLSETYSLDRLLTQIEPLNFRPHYGWRGKIESQAHQEYQTHTESACQNQESPVIR
ncbi:MAG: DUF362 domain-containing protein [candidate division Zixibacteria bacterium]|nr:DUF362 domain-containing protein [candidate division Zixibacteria bacterium]